MGRNQKVVLPQLQNIEMLKAIGDKEPPKL
jgi:hypothetical protein